MSNSSAVKKTEAPPVAAASSTMVVVCSPGKHPPPVVGPLETQMQSATDLKYSKTNTIQGAQAMVMKSPKAVAILCISDKTELVGALNFLVSLADRVANGTVRVMVINKINHPKIPMMLKGKGSGEVLDYSVTQKALSFKLNTALKLVHQAYQRSQKAEAGIGSAALKSNKQVFKGNGKSAPKGNMKMSKPSDSGAEIIWEKGLDFDSDIWLINTKKDVRCVLGRWLIHMIGPGPAAGTFEPSKITFEGESGWEWKPRAGKEKDFVKSEGRWVFFGRQPEFVWQKNIWSFVSNHPTMAFYVGDEARQYRMLCEKGTRLLITENSVNAKGLLEAIKETIEVSIRLKNNKVIEAPEENKVFDDFTGVNDDTSNDVETLNDSEPSVESGEDESDLGWNMQLPDKGIAEEAPSVGPLLGGTEENDAEDLDWSGVGQKRARSPAEPKVESVGESEFAEMADEVALSSDGTPWKSGREAFAVIRLELVLKSKNGAALLKPEVIQLLEAQNQEAVLDAPAGVLKVGDQIVLSVKLTDGQSTNEFEALSSVVRFEGEPDEGRHVTVVKIDAGAQDKMEEVLKTYIERQTQLLEFFQTAKGF